MIRLPLFADNLTGLSFKLLEQVGLLWASARGCLMLLLQKKSWSIDAGRVQNTPRMNLLPHIAAVLLPSSPRRMEPAEKEALGG